MRRITIFLAILFISLVSLTLLIVAGMYVFAAAQQLPYSWMSGMWSGSISGMMGGNSQRAVQNPSLPYFGFALIVLVSFAIVGITGAAYYTALPELKTGIAPVVSENTLEGHDEKKKADRTPLASVVKTLTNDERKIVEVLLAHGGKYLQKYIRTEAGLSRLQTHRVVARLAERRIVMLERTGNTNQVLLVDWLMK